MAHVKVNLQQSESELRDSVRDNDHVLCDLLMLNAFGKARLKILIEEALNYYQKPELVDDIFASVMELAFNAIKANYKYLVALEYMNQVLHYRINVDKYLNTNSNIMEDRILLKTYTGLMSNEEVLKRVRTAIRNEGKLIQLENLAMKEERGLNKDELKQKEDYLQMVTLSKSKNLRISMQIAKGKDRLIIDIVNDAPITDRGLHRIVSKRKLFRKYYDEERIQDFYLENLDDSESAGFGSAMIDSRLLEMQLDPEKHFVVSRINNKTSASIVYTF